MESIKEEIINYHNIENLKKNLNFKKMDDDCEEKKKNFKEKQFYNDFEEENNEKYKVNIIVNRNLKFNSPQIENKEGKITMLIQNKGINPLPKNCYLYLESKEICKKEIIQNEIEKDLKIHVYLKSKGILTQKKQKLKIDLCEPEGKIICSVLVNVEIEINNSISSTLFNLNELNINDNKNELKNLINYFSSQYSEEDIAEIYNNNHKDYDKTFKYLMGEG